MKFPSIKLLPFWTSFLLSIAFFVIQLLTLKDYGPSWDETLHFSRGQAYLNFFLTGTKQYPTDSARRSFYQLDYHNGDFWFKENGGHPPINDILAATSNYIFYQKLNLLDDIASYHLFNIFVSSLLIFIIAYFSYQTFGFFASLISSLTLATYPLFFSEAHFNIKDPAEASFFAGCIWAFYNSLKKGNILWLILSIVFFTLGLGTKFNILFLPIIILLYLVIRYRSLLLNQKYLISSVAKIPKRYLFLLILSPLISLIILTLSWPYLWYSFPNNFVNVLKYYEHIGTAVNYQPESFYLLGFNTFPIQWIIYTTPLVVLFLASFGAYAAVKYKDIRNNVTILWLLWVIIPILRVTYPGTSIYGGIRQILEFLPPLALLSGLGGSFLLNFLSRRVNFLTKRLFSIIIILTLFIWPTYILLKMYPNQNVYFNHLIGGLKGAKEKNFPSWGNSYGNAYLQGVNWLNQNAEKGAKVSLIQGIEINTPDILYRPDINVNNGNWSGIDRKGEYLMELTFNDTGKSFYYTWEYVETFLKPLHEIKVDGVAILKIWKNDLDHTRSEYRSSEKSFTGEIKIQRQKNMLVIVLDRQVFLSRIFLQFNPRVDCSLITNGFFETSLEGIKWIREKDYFPFPQVRDQYNLKGNLITFNFAARKAQFIRVIFDSDNSCGLDNPSVSVRTILD